MKRNSILMMFTIFWNINCIALIALLMLSPQVSQPIGKHFSLVVAFFWLLLNWLFITTIRDNKREDEELERLLE